MSRTKEQLYQEQFDKMFDADAGYKSPLEQLNSLVDEAREIRERGAYYYLNKQNLES